MRRRFTCCRRSIVASRTSTWRHTSVAKRGGLPSGGAMASIASLRRW
jgi:hypothetical protein